MTHSLIAYLLHLLIPRGIELCAKFLVRVGCFIEIDNLAYLVLESLSFWLFDWKKSLGTGGWDMFLLGLRV